MLKNFKKTVLSCAILSGLIFLGCRKPPTAGKPWEVLFYRLPPAVSTANSGENDVFYILKQTHEPLFRKDDGQNFHSRILKSWRRNIESTRYEFCPNTTLSFDHDHAFSVDFFRNYIEHITKKFTAQFALEQNDGCFTVNFNQSRRNYLDYLSWHENAPSMKTSDNIETGLGPFRVESISKDKITLTRKKSLKSGYNSVILHEYTGTGDPNLQNRKIADFNRIPASDVPAWVADQSYVFNNIVLKSFNLIINHPDRAIRETAYNCMDIDQLRRIIFPAENNFPDMMNIIPVGIPGARPGKPLQACGNKKITKNFLQSLVFANSRTRSQNLLQKFMDDFYRKTGIPVTVADFKMRELSRLLFKRPHPFNFVIVSLNAVRPDYSVFFDYFLRKEGFLDFDLPHTTSLYQKMLYEKDGAKRLALAEEIARGISKQAVVLPLFQEVRTFYYPKEIKNLEVGKGFLEYPEVAEFHL